MGSLQEVLDLYAKNNFEDAEKMIIPLYKSFPEDLHTSLLYSKILINLNKIKEAENVLLKFLEVDSSNIKTLMQIATVYQYQNRTDEAVKIYEKCMELYPDNFDVIIYLAELYCNTNNIQKSIEILKNRLKVAESSKLLYHLGKMYAKTGEDDKAIELFNKHFRLNNTSKKSLYQLSFLYIKRYSNTYEGINNEKFKVIWIDENTKKIFWYYLLNSDYINADFFFNSEIYSDEEVATIYSLYNKFYLNGAINGSTFVRNKCIEARPNNEKYKGYDESLNNRKKERITLEQPQKSLKKLNSVELIKLAKDYISEEDFNRAYSVLKSIKKRELCKIVLKDYNQLFYECFDKQDSISHVNTHFKDDLSKERHGVFLIKQQELYKLLIDFESYNLGRYKKEEVNGVIRYVIPYLRCGYEGGRKGDKHILNNITILAYFNYKNIITAFPSDKDIQIKNKMEAL
jgi:hypothetical protein